MNRHLFDLNPNPVLIYEQSSLRILTANRAFQDRYGYSEPEIQALTLEDIQFGGERDYLDDVPRKRSKGEFCKTKSLPHQSKEGDVFYVNISSHDYEYEGVNARLAFIHDVTDRVEAQKEAQQAFEELNHHVNNSPLAMVKWDSNFRILEWSERAEEITGYSAEEVLDKTPLMFDFHGEDSMIVEKHIQYLIGGERDKTDFEVKMYRKDGTLLNARLYASVLRNKEGALVSVRTFIEDRTEQKKTERRYQRLFENANDGICVMENGKFIECNEEVLNIYGCSSKGEIIGKTPMDFSPEFQPDGEKSSSKAHRKIQKAMIGYPQVFEWRHEKKDGTTVSTEVSLNRMELGGDIYIQAIVRDLTEQKKAERKLRRSERLFRELFLKAPGAIIMVNGDNKVKNVNQSFEELFGYSKEELSGKDIDDVLVKGEDDRETARIPGNELKEGKFYSDVVRYTKEGDELHLLLGAIPVYLDEELIAGFGIYVNITEQKKYQHKLQQSLDEKQVLLEEIHHRVKNNLAIISGLLQLQAFESEKEKTRAALNDSQLRIQSMALVHELLYQSENFIDISFEDYLKKLIATMKSTLPFDHQHIDINICSEDVSLNINQAIPSAILINELVTNSFKHAFRNRASGLININLRESTEHIMISVEDNGIGLPEDFAMDQQSSIGMSLIQSLTRQLDGNLKIKNNEGSSFEIRFERAQQRGSSNLNLIGREE